MFQQLIASNASKTPRMPLTLLLSAIIHGLLTLLLIAVPLVHPETLANLQTLIAPPPSLSAPRRTIVKLMSRAGKPRPIAARPNTLFIPDFIPTTVDLSAFEIPEGNEDSDDIPKWVFQSETPMDWVHPGTGFPLRRHELFGRWSPPFQSLELRRMSRASGKVEKCSMPTLSIR